MLVVYCIRVLPVILIGSLYVASVLMLIGLLCMVCCRYDYLLYVRLIDNFDKLHIVCNITICE